MISKGKIIGLVVAVAVLATAVYIVYDLNGDSLDLSDRETRIIVTSSMDGDNHPEYWYECPSCGEQYIQKTSSSFPKNDCDPLPGDLCRNCNTALKSHKIDVSSAPLHSLVLIKKVHHCDAEDVHVGDVIAFDWNGRLTIHRVIDITATGFVTQGDNASGTESPAFDKVHGIVVGDSEWMGEIVYFAQNKTILLVMILVVLFVIVTVVIDLVRIHNNLKYK